MRSLPYLLKNDNNSWCACEPKLEEEEFVTPKKVFNSQVVFQCQCMPIFVRVQPISWVYGGYGHKENVAMEKPVWWKGNNQSHAFAHFCTWVCTCLHMPLTCLFCLHTTTCLPCTTQLKIESKKSRIALQELEREIAFCVHIAAATQVWAKETCVVVSGLSF